MSAARVYVAGATSRIDDVRAVQQAIVNRGGWITFDWTADSEGVKDDWSSHRYEAAERASLELRAVRQADALVLVADPKRGLGCYIEVGAALGQHIPVFLFGDCRESVFWYSPLIVRVDTLTALTIALELGA